MATVYAEQGREGTSEASTHIIVVITVLSYYTVPPEWYPLPEGGALTSPSPEAAGDVPSLGAKEEVELDDWGTSVYETC